MPKRLPTMTSPHTMPHFNGYTFDSSTLQPASPPQAMACECTLPLRSRATTVPCCRGFELARHPQPSPAQIRTRPGATVCRITPTCTPSRVRITTSLSPPSCVDSESIRRAACTVITVRHHPQSHDDVLTFITKPPLTVFNHQRKVPTSKSYLLLSTLTHIAVCFL